jgi:hypothetical protein
MITKIKKTILPLSSPITNNAQILGWLVDNQVNSYKSSQKNLLRNLIDDLTHIFGDPNKVIRLEFNNEVWILRYKDLTFNIFTSKGGGTSIELCNYSDEQIRSGERQEDIIDFLKELHKKINNLD